jgi:hypothetical protein
MQAFRPVCPVLQHPYASRDSRRAIAGMRIRLLSNECISIPIPLRAIPLNVPARVYVIWAVPTSEQAQFAGDGVAHTP